MYQEKIQLITIKFLAQFHFFSERRRREGERKLDTLWPFPTSFIKKKTQISRTHDKVPQFYDLQNDAWNLLKLFVCKCCFTLKVRSGTRCYWNTFVDIFLCYFEKYLQ